MANHVSALKRIAQTRKRTAIRRMQKGVLRASLRSFHESLAAGDPEKIRQSYPKTMSSIDKAAAKGLIHKNTAARLKSRLTARRNALSASKQ